jgi:hypothetical protein
MIQRWCDLRIDDGQRGHALPQFRTSPRCDAVGAIASGLRIAAILGDAEDDGEWLCCRWRRRACAEEEKKSGYPQMTQMSADEGPCL